METGELDTEKGLVGDDWLTDDGNYETQLAIMNSRIIELLAQDKERWKLAGDQLFIDLNLTDENLPHGTKLQIGSAILEVTPQPHNGCKKFVERFGLDAMKFVNSPDRQTISPARNLRQSHSIRHDSARRFGEKSLI